MATGRGMAKEFPMQSQQTPEDIVAAVFLACPPAARVSGMGPFETVPHIPGERVLGLPKD